MLRATIVALVTAALASGCIGISFDGGDEGAGGWAPVPDSFLGPDVSVAEAKVFTREQIQEEGLESVSCRGPFPLHDGDTTACTARYHQADGVACSQTLKLDVASGRLSTSGGSARCTVPPR